ncbi:b2fd6c5b-8801-4b42-a069-2b4a49e9ce1e [Thermothielavioides terrestris]|uniref:B2fd6c5b-8801-4b42-a069-2b4a49e9ce1e n=1 Tax=Thermothielavioides terrestris TaxID=2587410 RepID=A0A446BG00_9PEZI|nr:b2fd6c5b-8801-4b42-a069-2b4a49e9ce1e [Thermothielavioides terrestris]
MAQDKASDNIIDIIEHLARQPDMRLAYWIRLETSTLGACITYLWAGTSARSMYRCYTSQTIITMLDVPEIAQSTSTPSTSSTTTSSTSTSTTATAPAQTTTSGTGATTSGGSNNTGAIVGGVVGGVAGVALIAGGIAYLMIRNRNKNANAGSGTAYSAVAPGDTSYPGGGPTPSAMSPPMSQAGYFSPGSVGTTLRADTVTPYLAGATPMVPPEAAAAAYDPHRSYYDPSKPSEQHPGAGFTPPPPGGYAPYPGHVPAPYPPPEQASELDTTNIPAGHEGNPVEMAATSPTQR